MLFKQDWDKVKERFKALWEKEIIDRCSIAVPVTKDGREYEVIDQFNFENADELKRYYTDPEYILDRSIKKFSDTFYGGEALPCIFPNLGTGGHAAYFDADYKFAKDTVWFFPRIKDWGKDKMKFNPNHMLLDTQRKNISYLSKAGKDKFFVSMPDNTGSFDALAHLRSSDMLLLDMIEKPEAVRQAVRKLIDALKITGDEFYGIIKDNNDGGSTHGWMHLWCEGRVAQINCDLSVMISPQMFEEFVLPELDETSKWVDKAVYHLDGQEQIRHLDMILSVKGIDMIQWTPVAGQPKTSEFLPVLKKIQMAGKGLVLLPEAGEVEKILNGLSSKGLHLVVNGVKTVDEAKELVKKTEKWTRDKGD